MDEVEITEKPKRPKREMIEPTELHQACRREKAMAAIKRDCDGCCMCCKLLGIPELDLPAGTWCAHCAIGAGCQIYDDRPQSCSDFDCLWRLGLMGDHLKPDKCRAVFWIPNPDEKVIQIHVDVGRDWRKGVVGRAVERVAKRGWHVALLQGDKRIFIRGKGLPLPQVFQEALAKKAS